MNFKNKEVKKNSNWKIKKLNLLNCKDKWVKSNKRLNSFNKDLRWNNIN